MTAFNPSTPQPPSPEDFLLGGGGPTRKGRSASFLQIGASITGTISDRPEVRQQNDPETGLPKTWPDGNPIWQIVVPLQTTLRSTEIEDDDGVRYLYVAGSKKPESRSMHVAVAEAVRAAGAGQLEVGGQLTVTYTGNGPKSPNAPAVAQAPKQYSAVYVPAHAAALGVQPAATQAPSNPVAAAPSQPAATGDLLAGDPRLAHLTPEQLAGARAAGWTADQCAQMFPAPTRV